MSNVFRIIVLLSVLILVVLSGRLYPVAVISSQLVVGVLGHGDVLGRETLSLN